MEMQSTMNTDPAATALAAEQKNMQVPEIIGAMAPVQAPESESMEMMLPFQTAERTYAAEPTTLPEVAPLSAASQPEDALALEPGEITSSPAQRVAEMKRPLSPDSAAVYGSQEPKRVKETQTVECLHCGCSTHRWTACMSKCMHCGQRHLGGRCQALPIDHYTPGGFKLNKHYRPPGEEWPALKLTPVEAAVPDYTTTHVDRNASGVDLSAFLCNETPAKDMRGPAAITSSAQMSGTMPVANDHEHAPMLGSTVAQPISCTGGVGIPRAPSASSQPRAADFSLSTATAPTQSRFAAGDMPSNISNPAEEKMDAGRAALISVTTDNDFCAARPIDWNPNLGPRSSGANDMPLGPRKTGGFSSPVQSVPIKVEEDALPNSAQAFRDVAANTQTAGSRGTADWAGPVPRSKMQAYTRSVGTASSQHTAGPTAPPYGQTLFGIGGSSVGIGGQRTAAGAAPRPAPGATTNGPAQNDLGVWKKLEQHIRDAVKNTSRPGKPFNGSGSRGRTNTKVQEASNILKSIILGTPPAQAPKNNDSGADDQAVLPGSMMVPTPAMMQQQQLPPQPPQRMMMWNWGTGTWQFS